MELTPEQLEAARELLAAELEKEITEKLSSSTPDSEEFEALVAQKTEENLAKMKSNMDAMSEKVQALTREKTVAEEAAKEARKQQLEEEGKHSEVLEMEKLELTEKLRLAEEGNLRLTRDHEVSAAIQSLEFSTERARDVTRDLVTAELTQDDEGRWVHRSGAPLADFVQSFVKDPKNEFLFKTKESSGTGTARARPGDKRLTKKVSEMSTQELLEAADNGGLGEVYSF